MNTENWIDFIVSFAEKMESGDYDGAVQMSVDIDFDDLTDNQAEWLEKAVTKIREDHNI